jgi:enamine deaminase RidA (YjgF/YER057c/UK114 family)
MTKMDDVRRYQYSALFENLLSDVVEVPLGGDKKLVYLAGVGAEDPEGAPLTSNVPMRGDVNGQLRWIWNRIDELLQQHGGSIRDVVKLTVYLTDARHMIEPFSQTLADTFEGTEPPVCTAVVVAGLAHPEMLAEIDATAVISTS